MDRWSRRNSRLRDQFACEPLGPLPADADFEVIAVRPPALEVVDSSSASSVSSVEPAPSEDTPPADATSMLQLSASVALQPLHARVLSRTRRFEFQLQPNATNEDVSAYLASMGVAERANDLVPLYPGGADLCFLLRPSHSACIAVAIHRLQDHTMFLLTLPLGSTVSAVRQVCAANGRPDICLDGRPLPDAVHLFDGMLLQLRDADMKDVSHFVSPGANHASMARSPLLLEPLLPAHMARPHNLGICHDMVTHCTDGFEISRLRRDLPSGLFLPRASRDLTDCLPVWPPAAQPLRLMLYTDGSFCPAPLAASWAVATFADCADHDWHWAGFAAGSAPCSADNAVFSAFEAELYALGAACAISLCARPVDVTCVYDSQSAAAVANCLASTAGQHSLAAAVRSFTLHALQLVYTSVSCTLTATKAIQAMSWWMPWLAFATSSPL